MQRATTLPPTPEVEVEDIANSQSDEAKIVPRVSLSLRIRDNDWMYFAHKIKIWMDHRSIYFGPQLRGWVYYA